MQVQEMIQEVYNWLYEDADINPTWTKPEILKQINLEQKTLGNWLRNAYENYIVKTITYDFSTTNTYSLPFDLIDILQVKIYNSNNSSNYRYILKQIPAYTNDYNGYYLENRNLIVSLLNDSNTYYNYDKIEIKYAPLLMDLSYGTPILIDTNKIKLTDDTRQYNDVYNNYYIEIWNGTELVDSPTGYGGYSGSGGQIESMGFPLERYTIIDWDGANRVATLDRDIDIVFDTTTEYSLISLLPEAHHELLVLGAAIRLFMFDNDRAPAGLYSQYRDKLTLFKKDIEDRSENFSRGVYINNINDYDFTGGIYDQF